MGDDEFNDYAEVFKNQFGDLRLWLSSIKFRDKGPKQCDQVDVVYTSVVDKVLEVQACQKVGTRSRIEEINNIRLLAAVDGDTIRACFDVSSALTVKERTERALVVVKALEEALKNAKKKSVWTCRDCVQNQ